MVHLDRCDRPVRPPSLLCRRQAAQGRAGRFTPWEPWCCVASFWRNGCVGRTGSPLCCCWRPSLPADWPLRAIAEDPPFRELLSRIPAKTPSASLECLRVRDGFRVELMCAEPLVCDPIAIDWGPDGRLWVVDMGDYPLGGGETPESRGCIKYLEDTDGDGKYDQSHLFLDKLGFPTGVMPWRDGVLITCCAGHLVRARYGREWPSGSDRRALHRIWRGKSAASRQRVALGSSTTGSMEPTVTAAVRLRPPRRGSKWISMPATSGSDLIRANCKLRPAWPSTVAAETTGATGLVAVICNRVGTVHSKTTICAAIPYLAPPEACIDLMDPPTCAPVFPISQELPRFNELWTLNRFTASCGLEVYRDDLFGPDFAHSYFVCEPAYNLVHRSVLFPKGTTFFSRRAPQEQTSEFLASTDIWFRPVQARTGPDGGLWIVDMYRLIIEHPEYIPERWHSQLDFLAGRGMGRIYRILPKDVAARPIRPISRLPVPDLVRLLDSPNGPVRDQVQQLLRGTQRTWGRRCGAQLAAKSPERSRVCRRLCTLEGLGVIDVATLLLALGDDNPNVRRHAVRLSEPLLATSRRCRPVWWKWSPIRMRRSACNLPTHWANGRIHRLPKLWRRSLYAMPKTR